MKNTIITQVNADLDTRRSPDPDVMDLDNCIQQWLITKKGHSGSFKTETAYRDTITQFRALLQSVERDLDSKPSLVSPIAAGYARTSQRPGREEVAPSTHNQRLAILSSFYDYAIKNDVLEDNPIQRIDRRVINSKDAARHIPPKEVKKGLGSIDRSTLEGKRAYPILSVALATGRRVNEIAGLKYGDIQKQGDTCIVTWTRCKGNKMMIDNLPEKTTTALYDYLIDAYKSELGHLRNNAPVWISFSNRTNGKAIQARTIQRLCEKYLGTSKFHATRHTWAVTMSKQNASLQQISKGLGHNNLATTSAYLEEQLGYENPYAESLEDLFGI
jgi:site-specific recombinase XerD